MTYYHTFPVMPHALFFLCSYACFSIASPCICPDLWSSSFTLFLLYFHSLSPKLYLHKEQIAFFWILNVCEVSAFQSRTLPSCQLPQHQHVRHNLGLCSGLLELFPDLSHWSVSPSSCHRISHKSPKRN